MVSTSITHLLVSAAWSILACQNTSVTKFHRRVFVLCASTLSIGPEWGAMWRCRTTLLGGANASRAQQAAGCQRRDASFVECKWEYNCRHELYRWIETNIETYRRFSSEMRMCFLSTLFGCAGARNSHMHPHTPTLGLDPRREHFGIWITIYIPIRFDPFSWTHVSAFTCRARFPIISLLYCINLNIIIFHVELIKIHAIAIKCLNDWIIFHHLHLNGPSLPSIQPDVALMPTNDAINKLFKINFTIVRVPHLIFCVLFLHCFAALRIANIVKKGCRESLVRCLSVLSAPEPWPLCIYFCASLRSADGLSIFLLFSYLLFIFFLSPSSFWNRSVSGVAHLPNRKSEAHEKPRPLKCAVKFYFTRKYDNDMLRPCAHRGWARRRTNPLNTQYNSKLMHHSYAHSDWLENWAKFVFFPSSFVRSYCDDWCEWVTACLHAAFGNANLGGDWIVVFGSPNQKIDQTENVVCAVPLPLPGPPPLSSWPLPQNTKWSLIKWSVFVRVARLSSFSIFHFSASHIQEFRKSKLAAVFGCAALPWLWAREKHLLNMVMARKIYSNAILCRKFG